MKKGPSRRVWIRRGLGATAGLSLGGCTVSKVGEELWHWSAIAFGTEVSASFLGDKDWVELLTKELLRVERIFTLYDANSDLRRLNRDGLLQNPPSDLIEALEICRHAHELTDGVFDPTVQPLWELYSEHFKKHPADTAGPNTASLAVARAKVGLAKVQFDSSEVRLTEPGMALTLNGIAQGVATDKIAKLLRDLGCESALVNIGEFCAIGNHPDGKPWTVGIANPNPGGDLLDKIDLVDRGLATSGGYGYRFDPAGQFHHLFDPSGKVGFRKAQHSITVLASHAALADALATAGAVMDWERFLPLAESEEGLEFRRYEA